jgi:hypothetical protein
VPITITKPKVKVEESPKVKLPDELSELADEFGKVQTLIEKAKAALLEKAAAELARLESLQVKSNDLCKKIDATVAATYPSMIPVDPTSEELKINPTASNAYVAIGKLFKMEIKPAENVRTVVNPKLLPELMGEEVFWSKVKMNLKDVDDYLNPEERAAVIKEGKGKRRWVIEKKA